MRVERRSLLGIFFPGSLLLLLLAACGPPSESASGSPEGTPRQPQAPPTGLAAPGYRTLTLPFVEGAEPFRAAVGDLNEDGKPDLAVCGSTLHKGFVRLYLAAADGEFESRDLEVPRTPRDVLLTDLDGDGHLDLATANNLPATVTVFWGDGTGAFVKMPRELVLHVAPFDLSVGDLDSDGHPDLVGVSEGGTVGIFWGRGYRGFLANTYFQTKYGPSYVELADFDADGDLDLAVSSWREDEVLLYFNKGKRRFSRPRKVALATQSPFGLAVLDFNGDGRLDLLTPDLGGNPLVVHLGAEDGTFEEGPKLPAGAGTRDVQVADLDSDGRSDFVVTATGANRVFLYYGRDGGQVFAAEPLEAGQSPRSTAAADLNGDGLPDLVTPNIHGHDVTLFLSDRQRRIALRELKLSTAEGREALRAFASLESEYQEALEAYRADDLETAWPILEKVVKQGRELFLAGFLVPDQNSKDWIRFNGSLLLLADLFRYRSGDPAQAAAIEAQLAEEAEKLGHPLLAAIQWISVGETLEQQVGNREAAAAAYERALSVGERAEASGKTAPPRFLLDLAKLALDRLHATEGGEQRRLATLALPYPIDLQDGQVTRLILPHLFGYASPGRRPHHQHHAFALAHEGSFRGSFADYVTILLADLFPDRFGHPVQVAHSYLERYPDSFLSFAVSGDLLILWRKGGKDEEYEEELERVRGQGKRLGVEVEIADRA
jgi:tetratricopeptide (TPR) repeat protein